MNEYNYQFTKHANFTVLFYYLSQLYTFSELVNLNSHFLLLILNKVYLPTFTVLLLNVLKSAKKIEILKTQNL